MSNADKPAYPTLTYEQNQWGTFYYQSTGMSERTLIAAMCLEGIVSNYFHQCLMPRGMNEAFAKDAVSLADALIEELQKQKQ